MTIVKVLFLCTGNSARSQMAEAFLRRLGEGGFQSFSAGLKPSAINPYTRRVMDEVGCDLAGQRSKNLQEYLDKQTFDYLITVCDDADQNCPVFPGVGERLHWSFEDPAAFIGSDEQKLAKFRQIRDQIQAKIEGWVSEQR